MNNIYETNELSCNVSGSMVKRVKEREGGDVVIASSTPSDAGGKRSAEEGK